VLDASANASARVGVLGVRGDGGVMRLVCGGVGICVGGDQLVSTKRFERGEGSCRGRD
jgi:hypothetical protein